MEANNTQAILIEPRVKVLLQFLSVHFIFVLENHPRFVAIRPSRVFQATHFSIIYKMINLLN